jgi:hypothetical protein
VVGLLLLLTLQTPGNVQQAAQSITQNDVRRRIGIIADDSMRGRDTPSPELDKVAEYIAGEYRRFGLRPAGDANGYLQSLLARSLPGRRGELGDHDSWRNRHDTRVFDRRGLRGHVFETKDYAGELVLVAGPLSGSLGDTSVVAGKMLILASGPRNRGEQERVMGWKPAGIIVPFGGPDSIWTRRVGRVAGPQLRDPTLQSGSPLVIAVRMAALQPIVARLGGDLAAAGSAQALQVTKLGGAQLHVHARVQGPREALRAQRRRDSSRQRSQAQR